MKVWCFAILQLKNFLRFNIRQKYYHWQKGRLTKWQCKSNPKNKSKICNVVAYPALALAYFALCNRPFAITCPCKMALSFLAASDRASYFFLLGIYILAFFHSPSGGRAGFGWEWVSLVWLKNFLLMTILAGGLHLYLYRWGKQADRLKFDRGMANRGGNRFTFNNQVYDNMFWSLASGVSFWTAYESLLLWAHANDVGFWTGHNDNIYLFIGLFLVIPMWNSFWFFVFIARSLAALISPGPSSASS